MMMDRMFPPQNLKSFLPAWPKKCKCWFELQCISWKNFFISWPLAPVFGISNSMTINEAPLHQRVRIVLSHNNPAVGPTDVESRLMHLGFIPGEEIMVKRKAPIFHEPLLVEVRGRPVALNKLEASLIKVELIP